MITINKCSFRTFSSLLVAILAFLHTAPSDGYPVTKTNSQDLLLESLPKYFIHPSSQNETVQQPASPQPSIPQLSISQLSISQQRERFLIAEKAIKQGRKGQFRKLLGQLQDYPLYPYLLYAELKRRIHSAKTSELNEFLNTYSDSPLAYRLRRSRLFFLARNKRWKEYINFYRPTSNISLKCYYNRALIQTDQAEKSFSNIETIWLKNRSLPKSCDPVLSFWNKKGKLTPDLVWRRIQLAMDAGRSRLAKHLAIYLPSKEQRWVDTWYKIHHNPSRILKRKLLSSTHPMVTNILTHGMKRLARYNPNSAAKTWNKIKTKITLSPEQEAEVFKAIGKSFLRRDMPEALTWLGNIPTEYTDQWIRESRIRITLKTEDWQGGLHWINQLNEQEQASERWQYWRARALEGIGQSGQANQIYQHVARNRSYEGFLAAERTGLPYQFLHHPLSFTEKELESLKKSPGIIRARELLAINNLLDARREWYTATQNMDDLSLQMAAKIANEWNWHERSILTLGQSSYRDDLDIRFPIVHKEKVLQYANNTKIEPAWALSIMRQESAFATDARSPRNARGLMQLLPRTARAVARSLKTRLRRTSDLHKADINIRLGITYLRKVSSEFNNHIVLATAAYNAGEYRVRKWLPKDRNMATDIWIETVPFTETRNYLRKILAYILIYEHRLGQRLTPLAQRMPKILSRNQSVVIKKTGRTTSQPQGKPPSVKKQSHSPITQRISK